MIDQTKAAPLCVDCKFHSKEIGSVHHMCSWRLDPVTGGPGGFCDLERRYVINGSCGMYGTNFQRGKKIHQVMFQLFAGTGKKP